MPTRVTCPGCLNQVSPWAINKEAGTCGQCVRQARLTERGYGDFVYVREYTCPFCERESSETTAMSVVIEGTLQTVDYDCLLDRAEDYPDAARYATKWLRELRQDHAAEDRNAS